MARTHRGLSYLLEHPARQGGVEVPAGWPWFGWGRASLPIAGRVADDLRSLLARCAGEADVLGEAYQELLRKRHAGARRRAGSFYTPMGVARRLAALALESFLSRADPLDLRVCDPACGSGRFLLAAAELLAARIGDSPEARRAIVDRCLLGIDTDPIAAEVCRFNLARWAGVPRTGVAGAVLEADAFAAPVVPASFDAVVGNPPFLNQLQSATARTSAARRALASRFAGAVRPYTDTSALFLLRGLELLREGGRLALVQPMSLLATRDAEPVRRALAQRTTIEGLWLAGPGVCGAQVHVCAPILRVGPSRRAPIRRWRGAAFSPLPAAPARERDAATWAALADTSNLPSLSIAPGATLADLASATADFRDQFYGLRGCIVEDSTLTPAQRRAHPRLITTGLIDPGACLWGRRPSRLLGRNWSAPRADPAALDRAGLAPWSRARLVPKVLLATQTRILEALADPRGELLPVTPIITITPRNPADLWLIAAALLSPVLSAVALRLTAGAGLSAGAIKLSAKQALALPVPARCPEWTRAARLIRALDDDPAPAPRTLLDAGRLMCRAYRLSGTVERRLLAWYESRLASRRRRPSL